MLEHEWRAISSVLADVIGPVRVALAGESAEGLLPSLLSLHMRPSLISNDRELEGFKATHPGVPRYPTVAEAMERHSLEVCIVSCLHGEPHISLIPIGVWAIDTLILILKTDASPEHVSQLHCALVDEGWLLHPRHRVAEVQREILSGVGVQILAFARRGVSVSTPIEREVAGRRQLAIGLVRPGDRTLVVAPDAGETMLMLEATAQPSRTVVLSQSLVLDSLEDESEFDFILWEQAVDCALDDAVFERLVTTLVSGGRLVLVGRVEAGSASEIFVRLEAFGLAIEGAWKHEVVTSGAQASHRIGTGCDEFKFIPSYTGPLIDFDVLAVVYTGNRSNFRASSSKSQYDMSLPNILAFSRDYDDPGIFRLIVTIGLRIESKEIRRSIARRYLSEAAPDSADFGAALCVLCYDWLEDGVAACGDELIGHARTYLAADPVNPTAFRWKVSVAFVMALVCERLGYVDEAAQHYRTVASMDVLRFSPLLGTKTIASLLALGWQEYGDDRASAARNYWSEALVQAKRLVTFDDWSEIIGSFHAPETFGMPELGAILDEAGRAAAALRSSEGDASYRGKVWQAAGWTRQARLAKTELALKGAWRWAERLEGARKWLSTQHEAIAQALAEAESSARTYKDSMAEVQEAKEWLEAQYRSLSAQLDIESGRVRALEERLSVAEQNYDSVLATNKSMSSQVESLDNELSTIRASVDALAHANRNLEESKSWLEFQVLSYSQECDKRGEMLESTSRYVSSLEEAKRWLEGQLESHSVALVRHKEESMALLKSISDLRAENSSLLQRTEGLSTEISDMSAHLLEEKSAREAVNQQLDDITLELDVARDLLDSLEKTRWVRMGKFMKICNGKING